MTPDEYVAEEDVYSADHASPAWRPATWAWLLTWFLLGGFCFVQSSATSWTVPTLAKDAGARPAVAKRFESRAIQDIRTGMRVIADNPELNGQDAIESEISPATWRNIHLRMEKPDGSELKMTLLRSLDWLEERRGEVGRDIDVNLQELGVAGPATILAIEPCPPIETGSGKLVTGTFQHSAADVINLYVTGANEPIGTTSNHPFWSETRQDFVQAGSLERGEELRTATGKTVLVMNQVPRTESTPVFNLEVDVEHAYTVTSCGVVVHNSDSYITEHISENAALYPKLKDQLRLEALSASGIVVTNTSLHIGNRRIAVFDSATGKLYLGDSTGGGHLGVVQTHQLPVVNGRYVGGFVEIGENWRLNFNPTSGTFPYTNIDLPEGILDRLRGTGVIINGL